MNKVRICQDGKKWVDMTCKTTATIGAITGKCIVIHGNFIVLLLTDGVLSFETTEPEYFTLMNDYDIHPDSYKLIQHF